MFRSWTCKKANLLCEMCDITLEHVNERQLYIIEMQLSKDHFTGFNSVSVLILCLDGACVVCWLYHCVFPSSVDFLNHLHHFLPCRVNFTCLDSGAASFRGHVEPRGPPPSLPLWEMDRRWGAMNPGICGAGNDLPTGAWVSLKDGRKHLKEPWKWDSPELRHSLRLCASLCSESVPPSVPLLEFSHVYSLWVFFLSSSAFVLFETFARCDLLTVHQTRSYYKTSLMWHLHLVSVKL